MLTKEQMAWLKGELNFESLADLLAEAKKRFPERSIVPTLVICGRTGAGKSSLINALAGRYVESVGVLPTTEEPTARELEGEAVPLRLLDMPGVGEAGKHGERIQSVLDQADRAHLILLAVPCPERSLGYEEALLQEVAARPGKKTPPVLLCGTKIDCAPPAREWQPKSLCLSAPKTTKERNIWEWAQYVQTTLHGDLGIELCCCGDRYDDENNQYGIKALRLRILELLPEAARTFFARLAHDSECIDIRAEHIVRTMSAMAGTAASQPLPAIPDAALIMPIQVAMLIRLTSLHGRSLSADTAIKLLGPLAARVAGRFAFSQLTKMLPGVGSLVGAGVAGSMTYALGMGYHTLLCDGHWNFDAEALKREVLKFWEARGKVKTEKTTKDQLTKN